MVTQANKKSIDARLRSFRQLLRPDDACFTGVLEIICSETGHNRMNSIFYILRYLSTPHIKLTLPVFHLSSYKHVGRFLKFLAQNSSTSGFIQIRNPNNLKTTTSYKFGE